MSKTTTRLSPLFLVAFLVGCGAGPDAIVYGLQADRFAGSEWSPPVNLGPVVNSAAGDMNAGLSPNEHALYFVSTRDGGLGNTDIWISRRQCLSCPWETPVNVGAPINSDAQDGAPTLSENGQLLFFFSSRAGGLGLQDLYVSHRVSTGPDGDVWGDPVNLGPLVNTSGSEQGVNYVREGGTNTLYFNRILAGGNQDIYRVAMDNDGVPLGAAVAVPELNDVVASDQKVAVRTDGHELLMSSARAGGLGGQDIWVSVRGTHHDAWSTPVNAGPPLNTSDGDTQPNLSRDGRTVVFTSGRAGGSGGNDLWMSTRWPSSQDR